MPADEELCLLQGNHEQAFTPGKAFTQSICSQGHGEQRAHLRNHLSQEAKHQRGGQAWKMSYSMENNVLEPSDKVTLALWKQLMTGQQMVII